MVAVAGSPTEPEVLDRRRIEIADRAVPGSVQPYHWARDLILASPGIAKARKFLDSSQRAAREFAAEAIRKGSGGLGPKEPDRVRNGDEFRAVATDA